MTQPKRGPRLEEFLEDVRLGILDRGELGNTWDEMMANNEQFELGIDLHQFA